MTRSRKVGISHSYSLRKRPRKSFRRVGSDCYKYPPLYWLSLHIPRTFCGCCPLISGVRGTAVVYCACGLLSAAVLAFDILFKWNDVADDMKSEEDSDVLEWEETTRTIVIASTSALMLVIGLLVYVGASRLNVGALRAALYAHLLLLLAAGVSLIHLFSTIYSISLKGARKPLLVTESGFRTGMLLLLPVLAGPYIYAVKWRLCYRPGSLLDVNDLSLDELRQLYRWHIDTPDLR